MSTIECQAPDCQNQFEPRAWNTKFCSNACKQANYRATHPERRARPKRREEWSNSRANRTSAPDDQGTGPAKRK